MACFKNSRFEKRIQFLLDNPDLAGTEVGSITYVNYLGNPKNTIYPNCWGTAVYVAGGIKRMKQLSVTKGYTLQQNGGDSPHFTCISSETRPGYVGEKPMKLFLSTCTRTTRSPDTIVTFSWRNCLFSFRELKHAGICLGDTMFHQKGIGESFKFDSIDDFVAARPKRARKSMRVRYYNVNT